MKGEKITQIMKIAFGSRQAGQAEQWNAPAIVRRPCIFDSEFQTITGENRSVNHTGQGISHRR
jgi:hypothetical protein